MYKNFNEIFHKNANCRLINYNITIQLFETSQTDKIQRNATEKLHALNEHIHFII